MMALLLKGHSFPDPDDHSGQFVRFCNGYAFEVKTFYQEMPERKEILWTFTNTVL